MLILISILLLLIPIVFQYKIGNKSLQKAINIKFIFVCILSLILQVFITFLSFILSIYSISESGIKCATPATGILAISFLITILLLLLILIQIINKSKHTT